MLCKKRTIALILCVVFLLTAVGCSAFLATHFDHTHTGCHCATCAGISTAGNLLVGCKLALAFSVMFAVVLLGCCGQCTGHRIIWQRAEALSSLNVMLTE